MRYVVNNFRTGDVLGHYQSYSLARRALYAAFEKAADRCNHIICFVGDK